MLLEAKNVTYEYIQGGRRILNDFDFSLESGERVGLMAPSGFGKTTLCMLLAGYEKPGKGSILLDGKPLREYKGYSPIQMIWQHPEYSVNPRMRMKDILLEGGELPQYILDGLGIKQAWYERFPRELSGGELQRFCIARALNENTRFIIADEITTMLDLITQSEIWRFLLGEIKRRDLGLLAVSHSTPLLQQICQRVIELNWE